MKSVTTKRFRELYNSLPKHIQQQTIKSYHLWLENQNHPGLSFKKINTAEEIYSVRVSINYRAICLKESDTYIWFWIGTHSEYDKVIRSN